MTEIVYTDEFGEWWDDLTDGEQEDVAAVVEQLEMLGPHLGFPRSSDVKGTKHKLRELRVQSGGNPLRVFYAFDPKRQAVLLIGGNKRGDKRFYDEMIPIAEKLWEQYLAEQ